MSLETADIGDTPAIHDVGEPSSTTLTADVISLACRYCLSVDGNLDDPRALPCSHVFCLSCLIADREKNNSTKCPICSYVTDVPLVELPSVVKGEYKLLCDICVKDGDTDQFSKVYCTECATQFCKKHELMHEEIHRSHDCHMIGMDEYKLRYHELEIRTCPDHPKSPLNIACVQCLRVFCVQCLRNVKACSESLPHKFMPLDVIVEDLLTILEPLREQAREKDRQISELVKSTSVILSVWDNETKEMIKTLHKTRDQQIDAIRQEYEKLELTLRRKRDKGKAEITKYLDEEAGVKMDDLQTELLKFDAKLKDVHMVELVTHHKQLETTLRELIEEDFPFFILSDDVNIKLSRFEGCNSRCAELELKQEEPYEISLPDPPLEDKALPAKIQLIREIPVDHKCITVCSHRGALYVGHSDGSVIKVDKLDIKRIFVKQDQSISSVRANKGKIFILTGNGEDPYTVYVYDTGACPLASWKHSASSSYFEGNKLSIDDTKITIVDQESKNISVYSHSGQKLKDTICPYIYHGSEVVICAGPSDSVIVSYMDDDKVFQLSMKTGEEKWMCEDIITNPQGVARYGEKYLLVTNKRSKRMEFWILDIRTGKNIGTITDEQQRPIESITYDLYIDGNTLLIPLYDEKKVLIYKLEKESRKDFGNFVDITVDCHFSYIIKYLIIVSLVSYFFFLLLHMKKF